MPKFNIETGILFASAIGMRRTLLFVLPLAFASPFAVAQEASPSVEQQVIRANNEFFQAAMNHDAKTLDKRVVDAGVLISAPLLVTKGQLVKSGGRALPLWPKSFAAQKKITLSGEIQNIRVLKVTTQKNISTVEGRIWVSFPGQSSQPFSFKNIFVKDTKNDKGWKLLVANYTQAKQTLDTARNN